MDILEAAKIACDYISKMTLDEFSKDVKSQDAVIRRLEIIGEATGRITEETQQTYSGLPWSDMKRMRNLLIHEYDDIDLSIVWQTVKDDLPPIIAFLEKIIPR